MATGLSEDKMVKKIFVLWLHNDHILYLQKEIGLDPEQTEGKWIEKAASRQAPLCACKSVDHLNNSSIILRWNI